MKMWVCAETQGHSSEDTTFSLCFLNKIESVIYYISWKIVLYMQSVSLYFIHYCFCMLIIISIVLKTDEKQYFFKKKEVFCLLKIRAFCTCVLINCNQQYTV